LRQKIDAVRLLAPSLFLEDGTARKDDDTGVIRSRKGRPTWTSLIEEQVRSAQMGIVQRELLAVMREGPFGDRLKVSESGYYNAIQKLLKRGLLKKRGDRLFTPAQYSEYMMRLERGEVEDVAEVGEYGSPAAAIMVRHVHASPGCASADVIEAVWKAHEGDHPPSKTSLYNMIARLIEQRHIRREDKKLYPYEENEAPNEGASEAGEVRASPNDGQPRFTLVS